MTNCVFSIHFSSFCVCALLFKVMARAMKATTSGVFTQTQVVASVAETNGLKNKQVIFTFYRVLTRSQIVASVVETHGLKNKQVNLLFCGCLRRNQVVCLVFISVSSEFLLCISNCVVLTQYQIVASVAKTNGI